MSIYHYFEAQRMIEKKLYGNATTFRRTLPKIRAQRPVSMRIR